MGPSTSFGEEIEEALASMRRPWPDVPRATSPLRSPPASSRILSPTPNADAEVRWETGSEHEMAVGAVTPPSPSASSKGLAEYLPGHVLGSPTPLRGGRRYRRSRPPCDS